jgi:GNAT superfamily N-acetyltransferase
VDLSWLDADGPSVSDLAGAVGVFEAARQIDAPHEWPRLVSDVLADLRFGWDGDPVRMAVTRDGDGRPIGVLTVELGRWDNTHLGWLGITVHPRHRRRGLGSALFKAGVDEVRNAGRTLVLADSWAGSAGVPFAAAMGLEPASTDVKRRQDLASLDRAHIARLVNDSWPDARDYELVRVEGAVPAELRAAVAALTGAINDAPTDALDIEDELFTEDRILGFERAQLARDRRTYRLMARHRETGELVGHTVVAVLGQRPWLASQLDTSVVRAHRGHRLGLILKGEMLAWLAEVEPQLAELNTWNAASNAHMIEVNELLGYRVLAGDVSWQLHLTT